MSAARTFPHGVTSWIDVEVGDLPAAQEFYGGVFGWTFETATPPDLPYAYVIATLDGQEVAGLTGPAEPVADAAQAVWRTYVAVDDVDATCAVGRAGGWAGRRRAGRCRSGRQVGERARSLRRGDQPLAGPVAARRTARQRAGRLELQRPAHRRPGLGAGLLRAGLRLGVRRPGVRDDDPGAGLRRPPRRHQRPRHPRAPGHRTAGVRRRDRRDHSGRGPGPALARHLQRGRPRRVGRPGRVSSARRCSVRQTTTGPEGSPCATRRARCSPPASSLVPEAASSSRRVVSTDRSLRSLLDHLVVTAAATPPLVGRAASASERSVETTPQAERPRPTYGMGSSWRRRSRRRRASGCRPRGSRRSRRRRRPAGCRPRTPCAGP